MTPCGVAYRRGWLGAPGDDASPLLLLAHGTGFHALVWQPTINALHCGDLANAPIELIAFDWSGHGLSRPLSGSGASAERCHWDELGSDDVLDVLEAAGGGRRRPVYGIGHSFGGGCLVLVELARPGTFSGLILFEPVIRPEPMVGKHVLAELALRRRSRFEVESHHELVAHFEKAFSGWTIEAVEAYVQRGFRCLPDGKGFELCCEPEAEASVYLGGMTTSVVGPAWCRLGEIQCTAALAVGRASRTLGAGGQSGTQAFEKIAAAFPRLSLPLATAPCGHNIPMEDPVWTAAFVAAALGSSLRDLGGGSATVPHGLRDCGRDVEVPTAIIIRKGSVGDRVGLQLETALAGRTFVKKIVEGGLASAAGLEVDDVIACVNHTRVTDRVHGAELISSAEGAVKVDIVRRRP